MKNKTSATDKRAYDILAEKPESFEIEGLDGKKETLYLHPLQLGRLAMISRRLLDIDLSLSDETENEVQKMWRICAEKPHEVAEIIAIATLRTKQEIDERLTERTELLLNSPTMQPAALTNILYSIVFQSYCADFMKAILSVKTLQVTISPEMKTERIATTGDEVSGDKSTLS